MTRSRQKQFGAAMARGTVRWDLLKSSAVRGDRDAPLIIALHGFLQSVRDPVPRWRQWPGGRYGWRYWNFPAMSQLLEECRRRRWSCWMPQAPGKNWRPKHARKDDTSAGEGLISLWPTYRRQSTVSMVTAARQATGSAGPVKIVALSDGATLAALIAFLTGSEVAGTFVIYSGVMPRKLPPGLSRFRVPPRCLVVNNKGEAQRIIDHSVEIAANLRRLGATVEDREHDIDYHTFGNTAAILDWV